MHSYALHCSYNGDPIDDAQTTTQIARKTPSAWKIARLFIDPYRARINSFIRFLHECILLLMQLKLTYAMYDTCTSKLMLRTNSILFTSHFVSIRCLVKRRVKKKKKNRLSGGNAWKINNANKFVLQWW